MDSLAEVVTNYVTLLVALSVATERFVEIIKNIVPWLNTERKDDKKEGIRRAVLHAIAIVGGIITALLAKPAVSVVLTDSLNNFWGYIALGLLASGGSGFWNSILTYLLEVKNIKEETVKQLKDGPLKQPKELNPGLMPLT